MLCIPAWGTRRGPPQLGWRGRLPLCRRWWSSAVTQHLAWQRSLPARLRPRRVAAAVVRRSPRTSSSRRTWRSFQKDRAEAKEAVATDEALREAEAAAHAKDRLPLSTPSVNVMAAISQRDAQVHGLVALVLGMYVFGSQKPLISQTTAVTLGLTQFFLLATTLATARAIHGPSTKKIVDDDSQCRWQSLRGASELLSGQVLCGIAAFAAVALVPGVLRSCGALETLWTAVPVAFVLGGIGAAAARLVAGVKAEAVEAEEAKEEAVDAVEMAWRSAEAELEADYDDVLGNNSDPYGKAFWDEVEPLSYEAEEVIDHRDLLADVMLKMM